MSGSIYLTSQIVLAFATYNSTQNASVLLEFGKVPSDLPELAASECTPTAIKINEIPFNRYLGKIPNGKIVHIMQPA